jgi:bacterioferritin-associated ferredoxin
MAPVPQSVCNSTVANDYQTRYQKAAAKRVAAVYICLCNALTDADIRRAATADGARRPAEVFAACRCRAQCGTCVKSVCALLGLGLREARDAVSGQALPVAATA